MSVGLTLYYFEICFPRLMIRYRARIDEPPRNLGRHFISILTSADKLPPAASAANSYFAGLRSGLPGD